MGRREQKQRIEGQKESKRKKEDQETSLGLTSTLMWCGSVGTVQRIQPSVLPRLLDRTAFGTPKLVGHKTPHRVAHASYRVAHTSYSHSMMSSDTFHDHCVIEAWQIYW